MKLKPFEIITNNCIHSIHDQIDCMNRRDIILEMICKWLMRDVYLENLSMKCFTFSTAVNIYSSDVKLYCTLDIQNLWNIMIYIKIVWYYSHCFSFTCDYKQSRCNTLLWQAPPNWNDPYFIVHQLQRAYNYVYSQVKQIDKSFISLSMFPCDRKLQQWIKIK